MRAFREYLQTPISTGRKVTGLFGNKNLKNAEGLTRFAQTSLRHAQSIVNDLRSSSTLGQAGATEIRKLDELSDTLCKPVDMAGFLRIAHPDPDVVDAAHQVHELLFGFMNELNTSHDLFSIVESALKDNMLQEEERKVAEILRHDFLKSGIQFDDDPKRRDRFVNLSSSISAKGLEFSMNCHNLEKNYLELGITKLSGVSSSLVAELAKSTSPSLLMKKKVRIPASSPVLEHILATASLAETRHKIWKFLRSAPLEQQHLLDDLLRDRQELAQLAGYQTFADYELSDKMMHNSANVDRFLTSLAKTAKPLVNSELVRIGDPPAPWDGDHYYSKYISKLRQSVSPPSFELTSVFQTINELVGELYGLRFEPGEIESGEVWSPDVRRLDVYDGTQKVGVIYCDLLAREGKRPNPAHFTIQCSRRKYPSEEMQLPIIALVCDFEPQGLSGTVMLDYREVQTLFHEMGHAIHSMVGRTRLQNVAGTRCATDFVELPSILFEKFVSEPTVLKSMKPTLDADLFLAKQAKLEAAIKYWETWYQISLSFLDQSLHGRAFAKLGDSSTVANQITEKYTLFDRVPMSRQHTKQFLHFGHLVSYGATYYSYLFDKCLASMTWDLLFKDRTAWDKGGHRFKEHVLQWGGGRDPQECLESLLGRELDHREVAASLIKK